MVLYLILSLIRDRPAICLGTVLVPWSWKRHQWAIPGVGPAVLVMGYMWGYRKGQMRDRKRRKFMEISQVKDLDQATLKQLLGDLPAWIKFPDYDRVSWLNNAAVNWWPCLSTAICRTVKWRLEALMQKKKPDLFSSIVFETFSLGSTPPRCSGAKVYNTQEEEIILDLEMTWVATNADIVLSTRLAKGTVALPVQLSQVMFQGTVRLIFKPLVPQWPCFGAISIAFVGKPQVDFSLRLIGGELMSVPGLAPSLHDLLKNRLFAMMVWPRRVYAPIMKELQRKKDGGQVKNRASGLIRGHLIEAKSLRTSGLSAVFVVIEVGGVLRRSAVCKGSPSVLFDNEDVLNFIVEHPEFEALRATVYEIEPQNLLDAQLLSVDELTDRLRHKVEKEAYELDPDLVVRKIGEGLLPILSAPSRKTADIWLDLGEGNGQVHLDFQYVPLSDQEGQDLLDPEVELEMLTPFPTAKGGAGYASYRYDRNVLEYNERVPSEDGQSEASTLRSDASASSSAMSSSRTASTSSSMNSISEDSASLQSQGVTGVEGRKGGFGLPFRGRKRRRSSKGKDEAERSREGEEAGAVRAPVVPPLSHKGTPKPVNIGVLYVSLIEAKGLVTSDWSGLCSAFVRLTVGRGEPIMYESRIASKSLVPQWNQTFEIIIPDTREYKVIYLEVWDQGSDFIGLFSSSAEFIGRTSILIEDLMDAKRITEDCPIYGSVGDEDKDVQTGQVRMSFEWVGAPLSTFYVTPTSNPREGDAASGPGGREPLALSSPEGAVVSPSATEYVKKTGKRIALKVVRAIILCILVLLLLTVLALPSLRAGAGLWFIKRWQADLRPHWLKLVAWWLSSPFALAAKRLVAHWLQAAALARGRALALARHVAVGFSLSDAERTWSLLQWLGAEAMLVMSVLLTVKFILWADRNGVVSALMQSPRMWFDMEKVSEEWKERQRLMGRGASDPLSPAGSGAATGGMLGVRRRLRRAFLPRGRAGKGKGAEGGRRKAAASVSK